MSGRIQGLSIGLGMESADVARSISSIRRSIRGLNSEAKLTSNNMKFGARDTASYKKNLDQLSDTTEKQRKNVEDLGKRYEATVESQGASSKAAQNLATEFNKQADNLNRLESQLSSAKDEMHELYVEQSRFTRTGNAFDTAGTKVQAFGGQVRQVGGSLTRWITAPVLGAVTAVGGLTAAFGWGRLTGLDSAKAQLEGLGYSTKEVKSITDEVSDAIQGGMMTMAEGTSTAAGAMAAGVEQGEELTRYLQLVDAAAVGANRPVGEMAQIFNRVQGSGKLMTEELNRIEDGMPGFSLAMAEHAGVTLEEFRKMVTDGQIETDAFLDVMEDFAGGMAAAQADSWQGMLSNTKAWIGILGENMLSGVFEQSKESLNEFLTLLSSDQAQQWATQVGTSISNTFSTVVESVKSGVEWFRGLGVEKQKLIGIIAGVAVAAGPLLTVFGGLTIFIGKVVSAIAPLFFGLGRVSASIKTAGGLVKWMTPFLGKLGAVFGVLTGPIGLTVAAIAALGTGLVIAYNKSESFRNFIGGLGQLFSNAWAKAMEFKDNMIIAFQGIFAIFQGDNMGGLNLLRSLGLSEESISTVVSVIETVKGQFRNLQVQLGLAFSAISGFAQEMFAKLMAFWQSDGQQFIQAMINAFNLAKSIILPVVSAVFNGIVKVIQFAMPLALSIIKMIWENIQGVIRGGLDIIMGLVKTFSGLFTGDFSKMWEGVKQIFSGAIELVWNGFQLLFWGRIIRGVGTLVRTFSGSIRGLWQNVVQFFQNMYQGAVTRVRNLWTSATNIGNTLNTTLTSIISRMVTSILNFFRNLFTRGRNIISDLRTSITSLIGRMRDGAVNGVTRMRDRIVDIFTRIKDRGSSLFNDLVDGARKLPGRIGTAIKNMASKAVDGAIAMGNSIASKLEDVVNSVVGGLNKILNAIGLDDPISEISIKRFSTGTSGGRTTSGRVGAAGNIQAFSTGTRNGRIAQNMLGILNDRGPGNGAGGAVQEVIEREGKFLAPQGKDALVELEKNDTIYNGAEVQSMQSAGLIPRFSRGSGTEGGDSGNKGLLGTFKDVVSNVWSYITDPGKAFSALMDTITPDFSGFSGFAGEFLSGGFDFLTSTVKDFITNIFKENEGALGSGQKYAWMNYPMSTPYSPNSPVPGYPTSFNGGRHYGVDFVTPVGTTVRAPMAGQLSAFNNAGGGLIAKLVTGELRQFFMHMSSVASPGSVSSGDVIGRTGNSGQWTYGSGHVHYQAQQGTDILNRGTINPMSVINGHLFGGRTLTDGLFNLHGGEYIINPNNPSEAMKLLALAGKELAGKSKQTRELPNPGRYEDDNKQLEIINLLTKQNQILMKLLNKDMDIYMDGEPVGRILDEKAAVNASLQMF